MRVELPFAAMGTTGLISVVGDKGLVRFAHERIDELEARWSRFRPDSELSRLRAANGDPVAVSADTFRLLRTACGAWRRTHGLFDPTVLDSMIANGYDRTFVALDDSPPAAPPQPAPGAGGILLDPLRHTVTLPRGVGVDAGGIGKGVAADIVTEEVMCLGARGVLIDIGGDIRCAGAGPCSEQWVIDVAHPLRRGRLLHLLMTGAGVATSSTVRRRWGPGGSLHHIVDPATGRPAGSPVVAATVVAADAASAEALATAVVVGGDVGAASDASAIAVHRDGTITGTSDLLELVA